MWHKYITASNINDVVEILAEKQENARIVAGATDLILEMERGQRKGVDTLIDISRIPNLDHITTGENGYIHLGPMVTHNHCVGSKLLRANAFPLVKAAWEVGSPQIRNRGTIAGNLITASPANDTIPPLFVLDGDVTLLSVRGKRIVPIKDFYTGVRKTVMKPDEMLVDISFPAMSASSKGTFIKYALRKAQAISLLNIAVILEFDGKVVKNARIALGAVAPTIIHSPEAERFLAGKELNEQTILQAAELVSQSSRPIDDVRSSGPYRKSMVSMVAKRALIEIRDGMGNQTVPEEPVLLWGNLNGFGAEILDQKFTHVFGSPIETIINGKKYRFESGQGKTLLRLLREEGELIGTKEGCAEGECGACTVFLDGKAVMSCMVPAPRAHLAEIVTIEGLAKNDQLNTVQSAFVEEGAVQCGYCTPGFVMSATKLLEEIKHPTQDQIKQSITGNLCRCTGYYKIIKAIEKAAEKGAG